MVLTDDSWSKRTVCTQDSLLTTSNPEHSVYTRILTDDSWSRTQYVPKFSYWYNCSRIQCTPEILNWQQRSGYANWVFHVRPIWYISVRLSDRYKVTQHKTNFIKNCPQWGLDSQHPDHQSHALPTVLSHYLVVGVNQQGLYKVMLHWF